MVKDHYFIDYSNFPIDKFRNILKNKDVLPGRIILKEDIDERFDLLQNSGFNFLLDLVEELKTKSHIEKLSRDIGLSIEYLTILRREANSFTSQPVNLIDMPFHDNKIIEKLISAGIKDSRQLFNSAAKKAERIKLANELKLPDDKLLDLVRLCDLVRITGVGPVFAGIIFSSEIRSVSEFLALDPEVLFRKLIDTNTNLRLSLKDIIYCIELGRELPLVLEI